MSAFQRFYQLKGHHLTLIDSIIDNDNFESMVNGWDINVFKDLGYTSKSIGLLKKNILALDLKTLNPGVSQFNLVTIQPYTIRDGEILFLLHKEFKIWNELITIRTPNPRWDNLVNQYITEFPDQWDYIKKSIDLNKFFTVITNSNVGLIIFVNVDMTIPIDNTNMKWFNKEEINEMIWNINCKKDSCGDNECIRDKLVQVFKQNIFDFIQNWHKLIFKGDNSDLNVFKTFLNQRFSNEMFFPLKNFTRFQIPCEIENKYKNVEIKDSDINIPSFIAEDRDKVKWNFNSTLFYPNERGIPLELKKDLLENDVKFAKLSFDWLNTIFKLGIFELKQNKIKLSKAYLSEIKGITDKNVILNKLFTLETRLKSQLETDIKFMKNLDVSSYAGYLKKNALENVKIDPRQNPLNVEFITVDHKIDFKSNLTTDKVFNFWETLEIRPETAEENVKKYKDNITDEMILEGMDSLGDNYSYMKDSSEYNENTFNSGFFKNMTEFEKSFYLLKIEMDELNKNIASINKSIDNINNYSIKFHDKSFAELVVPRNPWYIQNISRQRNEQIKILKYRFEFDNYGSFESLNFIDQTIVTHKHKESFISSIQKDLPEKIQEQESKSLDEFIKENKSKLEETKVGIVEIQLPESKVWEDIPNSTFIVGTYLKNIVRTIWTKLFVKSPLSIFPKFSNLKLYVLHDTKTFEEEILNNFKNMMVKLSNEPIKIEKRSDYILNVLNEQEEHTNPNLVKLSREKFKGNDIKKDQEIIESKITSKAKQIKSKTAIETSLDYAKTSFNLPLEKSKPKYETSNNLRNLEVMIDDIESRSIAITPSMIDKVEEYAKTLELKSSVLKFYMERLKKIRDNNEKIVQQNIEKLLKSVKDLGDEETFEIVKNYSESIKGKSPSEIISSLSAIERELELKLESVDVSLKDDQDNIKTLESEYNNYDDITKRLTDVPKLISSKSGIMGKVSSFILTEKFSKLQPPEYLLTKNLDVLATNDKCKFDEVPIVNSIKISSDILEKKLIRSCVHYELLKSEISNIPFSKKEYVYQFNSWRERAFNLLVEMMKNINAYNDQINNLLNASENKSLSEKSMKEISSAIEEFVPIESFISTSISECILSDNQVKDPKCMNLYQVYNIVLDNYKYFVEKADNLLRMLQDLQKGITVSKQNSWVSFFKRQFVQVSSYVSNIFKFSFSKLFKIGIASAVLYPLAYNMFNFTSYIVPGSIGIHSQFFKPLFDSVARFMCDLWINPDNSSSYYGVSVNMIRKTLLLQPMISFMLKLLSIKQWSSTYLKNQTFIDKLNDSLKQGYAWGALKTGGNYLYNVGSDVISGLVESSSGLVKSAISVVTSAAKIVSHTADAARSVFESSMFVLLNIMKYSLKSVDALINYYIPYEPLQLTASYVSKFAIVTGFEDLLRVFSRISCEYGSKYMDAYLSSWSIMPTIMNIGFGHMSKIAPILGITGTYDAVFSFMRNFVPDYIADYIVEINKYIGLFSKANDITTESKVIALELKNIKLEEINNTSNEIQYIYKAVDKTTGNIVSETTTSIWSYVPSNPIASYWYSSTGVDETSYSSWSNQFTEAVGEFTAETKEAILGNRIYEYIKRPDVLEKVNQLASPQDFLMTLTPQTITANLWSVASGMSYTQVSIFIALILGYKLISNQVYDSQEKEFKPEENSKKFFERKSIRPENFQFKQIH